jgi:hypothetical protein
MAGRRSRQSPSSAEVVGKIVDAVSNTELTEYAAWHDLSVLSSHTDIDGIEVDPAGVTVNGNQFSGLATIYVALNYGSNDDDGFATSDAFEGRFEGHFEEHKPVIDRITVDTAPFYD